jgi:hypothetical protein
VVGCEDPNYNPRALTNEEGQEEFHGWRDAMVHNAMLSDMSVSTIHFVPHTTRLNSLGTQRLDKYAEMLAEHGGTLHLQSAGDTEFIRDRMNTVVEYLAAAGVTRNRIGIRPGAAQGRGLAAAEAIEVREVQFGADRTDITGLIGGGGVGTGN